MKLLVIASLLFMSFPLNAQEALWKCFDPERPFRFVRTEAEKDDPPLCRSWVQLRGANLASLLEMVASRRFVAANEFLEKSSTLEGIHYPSLSNGAPVLTSDVYVDPEQFGFKTVSLDVAPTGSIVVYDGLGGILVEKRKSEGEPWQKQVLYPSKAGDFFLKVSDIDIPGKMDPKIIIPNEFQQ